MKKCPTKLESCPTKTIYWENVGQKRGFRDKNVLQKWKCRTKIGQKEPKNGKNRSENRIPYYTLPEGLII